MAERDGVDMGKMKSWLTCPTYGKSAAEGRHASTWSDLFLWIARPWSMRILDEEFSFEAQLHFVYKYVKMLSIDSKDEEIVVIHCLLIQEEEHELTERKIWIHGLNQRSVNFW